MNLPRYALPAAQEASLPAGLPLYPERAAATPPAVTVVDDRGPGYLDRFIANVTQPTLTVYLPPAASATGGGVVICPGGGYHGVAIDKEGHDVARWLNQAGLAGFVLTYRSPSPAQGEPCRPYGPLRDAQRALRQVRARAAEWGVRPEAIGILGFSAGGHLAATASTRFTDVEETEPALAGISCRPDFTVLIYPVVSCTAAGVAHAGSCRNLLGAAPTDELKARFSCELQVNRETPPAFLAHTGDDPVPVANSLLYYQALRQAGVAAEMHLFPEGGHGYGLRQRGLTLDVWPDLAAAWLRRQVSPRQAPA